MDHRPPVRLVSALRLPARRTRWARHRHASLEIIHHLDCEGEVICTGEQRRAFSPGSTIIIPQGDIHERRIVRPGSAIVLRVVVDDDTLAPGHTVIDGPVPAWLGAELQALAQPPHTATEHDRLARDHRASAILHALMAQAGRGAEPDPDRRLVDSAAAWLNEHCDHAGSIADVARELDTDYDRLRRLFRRLQGRSLMEHLLAARIRRAQELLVASDLRIEEVASCCGFGTARHFATMFKRQIGQPPSAWRRQQRSA